MKPREELQRNYKGRFFLVNSYLFAAYQESFTLPNANLELQVVLKWN